LEGELHALQQASANAELRDLAGLSYVQASQKNYGLAARLKNRADVAPPSIPSGLAFTISTWIWESDPVTV
jgi:hypothetical protein